MCWRRLRRAAALAAVLAVGLAGQAAAVTLVPPKPNVFFGVSDRGTTAEFNEFAELLGKPPEICAGVGIQKKLQKEPGAGL